MDIPLNVDVHCSDGLGGRSTGVILNPVTKNVTNLVVARRKEGRPEYLVPIKFLKETTPELILLDCTRDALYKLKPFIETHFVSFDMPDMEDFVGELSIWPYRIHTVHKTIPVRIARIPPHELEIRRGAHVRARNAEVGVIDEFLVEPSDGHITHIVLRTGHLWGQKEVVIPVSDIDRFEEDMVYLKLEKKAVAKLPAVAA